MNLFLKKRLDKVFKKAESLLYTKYLFWFKDRTMEDIFYFDKIYPVAFVKKRGINCSGFLTFLVNSVGIKLAPSKSKARGGLSYWFNLFKRKKLLNIYEPKIKYPPGTILISPYKNEEDQGHLAIVYTLPNSVIHCIWIGVNITEIVHRHYQYYVKPESWLDD